MVRFFLVSLLITISLASFSQTVNDLDKKRSFKDFKLGDSYSKWQSNLQFERDKGDAKTYLYTGDNGSLFNTFQIHSIELTFKKSIIVDITITLEKWKASIQPGQFPEDRTIIELCNNKIQEVSNRFEILFGDPTITSAPKYNSGNNELLWNASKLWNGKTTTLMLALMFLELPSNTGVLVVDIADKDFLVKSYTDGF